MLKKSVLFILTVFVFSSYGNGDKGCEGSFLPDDQRNNEKKSWTIMKETAESEGIDIQKLLSVLHLGAEQGDVNAQKLLASFYTQTKNSQQAFYWTKKAAEQGDSKAQFIIEEIEGIDTQKLLNELHLEAEQGNVNAQQLLVLLKETAESKGVDTQTVLSVLHFGAEQGGIDTQKLLSGLHLEAEQGNVNAQQLLALLKETAEREGINTQTVLSVLHFGAEQGDIDTQQLLALFYTQAENLQQAFYWMKKAAEQGDSKAQFIIAEIEGIDTQELLSGLHFEAEQGNVNAQQLLASLKEAAKSEGIDTQKMLSGLHFGAEQGDIDAQQLLASFYMQVENFQQSFYWTKKAAEQGDPAAQFMRGIMLLQGMGVETDKKQGKDWMMKSANKGYPRAQVVIGTHYLGKQDFDQALHWLQKAAKQGDQGAQFMIEIMHFTPDSNELHSLQKAAERGHPQAQFVIGILHLTGNGVKRDKDKSRNWLVKAAVQQGNDLETQIFAFDL